MSRRTRHRAPRYALVRRVTFPLLVVLLLSCLLLFLCLLSSTPVTASLLRRAPTELYEVLGVPVSASPAVIKKAFRQLAREHHPDLQDGSVTREDAKTRMAALLRAYEVLSDPDKRQRYDSSGIVPGEEYTTASRARGNNNNNNYNNNNDEEELMDRFRQRAPIVSRTPSLDSLTALRRLRQYRGWRVFVIQIYDDDCSACRIFAPAWEALQTSPLVQSGVVRLYRVDALGPSGPALTETLTSSSLMLRRHRQRDSRKEPVVVGVVNGVVYPFTQLSQELTARRESNLYQALLGFVMLFLQSAQQSKAMLRREVLTQRSALRMLAHTSASAADEANLPQTGLRTRPVRARVRVWVPPMRVALDALAPALQMRYADEVRVHRVSRDTLQWFVEDYCGGVLDARDRSGAKVVQPDFIVAVQEPLPEQDSDDTEESSVRYHAAHRVEEQQQQHEEEAQEEASSLRRGHKGSRAVCRGVHIGVSASLNYAKAAQFVESVLPRVPNADGLQPLAHALQQRAENESLPTVKWTALSAGQFYDRCDRHCVLWLRRDCDGGGSDGSAVEQLMVRHALTVDSASFATGYICLRDHPQLQRALMRVRNNVSATNPSSTTTAAAATNSNNEADEYEATYETTESSALVVMMINGDDDVWYRIPVPARSDDADSATAANVLAASESLRHTIQSTLRAWVDEETLSVAHDDALARVRIHLPAPMTTLLTHASSGITYSWVYRVYFSIMNWLPMVKTLVTNTMPFVIMYFVHTRFIRPRQDKKNNNNTNNNHSNIPQPRRYVRRATVTPPPPENAVRTFHAAHDMAEARRGKGYLILILDRRPVAAGALALPRIAEHARFTVRVLGAGEARWRDWVTQLVAAREGDGDGTEAHREEPVTVVAIRKQRMKAMLMERGVSMESFLLDLLDGTRVPQVDLPESILTE